MSKANKVQSVYIEAMRATLTAAEIAKDLKCSVNIVRKYIEDNSGPKDAVKPAEEPVPKGETRISAMMKLNSAQKTRGVNVMTGAVSQVVDENRDKAKPAPMRTDCVTKIRPDKPVSN